MVTLILWLNVLFNTDPANIIRREALLREFKKATASNLPIRQGVPRNVGQPRSRKPPVGLVSQLVEIEILPKASKAIYWNLFEKRKKFPVSESINIF